MKNENVCIIGLGEIGSSIYSAMAESKKGVNLTGVDKDSQKLLDMSRKYDGKFSLTIPKKQDIYIIAVYTPQQIREVIYELSFEDNPLIIIESTMVPGETKKIEAEYPDISLVLFPHRFMINDAAHQVFNLDRIMGSSDKVALAKAADFYGGFLVEGGQIHFFDVNIVELSKPLENAYRYIEIAVAEELKRLCDKQGIDFDQLRSAVNTKWNVNLLEARGGVAKHCLVGDTELLTPHGIKLLRDIKVGDLVFDGKEYVRVIDKSFRYVRETIELSARGRKLRGSLDHLHFMCKYRSTGRQELVIKTLDKFKKKDKIYFPSINRFMQEPLLLITPRILGLYLAEGCMTQVSKRSGSIRFTFSDKEEFLADEIVSALKEYKPRKYFKVSAGTYGESRCWEVCITNKDLYQYFLCNSFGTNSKNKSAPLLNDSFGLSLVGGWLDGDGSLYKSTLTGHSESKELIKTISLILLQNKILCQIDKTGKKIKISRKKDILKLKPYLKRIKIRESFYKNKTTYASPTVSDFRSGWGVNINSIKKCKGTIVFAIETESEKYMANEIVTHNCLPKDCAFINAFFKGNKMFKNAIAVNDLYCKYLKRKGIEPDTLRTVEFDI